MQALVGRQLVPLADLQCLPKPHRTVVRGSDLPDFSFPDQPGKGRKRFFQRRLRVIGVGPVQIDVIRLQAFERFFRRVEDIGFRESFPAPTATGRCPPLAGDYSDAIAFTAIPS
ncbi:MAG: hypothetical protein WBX50_04235, partial [Candidatus Deferrimicrobiaceae bacterium]